MRETVKHEELYTNDDHIHTITRDGTVLSYQGYYEEMDNDEDNLIGIDIFKYDKNDDLKNHIFIINNEINYDYVY